MSGSTRAEADGSKGSTALPAPGFASLEPFYVWVGIHSGVAWLSREAARQHRMGRAGPTIYLSLGASFFDLVTVSASWGALFPKDQASFNEDVVPLFGGGSVTSAASSLQVTNYAAELGLRTPNYCLWASAGRNCTALHIFANVGRAVVSAERFVENCSDCASQKLELRSGFFLEPGVAFGVPSREKSGIDLRVSYRSFLGESGLVGEIRLGAVFMFL